MKFILTGCSKGIGKALLVSLLNNKHEVISISRNKTDLSGLLNIEVINWHEIQGDICDENTHQKLTTILSDWKKVDGIINNAGVLINKAFEDLSYEDVKTSFDVNFYAPLKLTQLAMPFLKRSKLAHHINIGSIGGVQGSLKFPGLSVYSSTKGALALLTECLAEEYKDSPIHFNCLALGAVQTEMLAQAFPGYTAPYSPDQMAAFIVNFIENSSPMMNGKIISVSASNP
jgi:short-subunit dehydrogenase